MIKWKIFSLCAAALTLSAAAALSTSDNTAILTKADTASQISNSTSTSASENPENVKDAANLADDTLPANHDTIISKKSEKDMVWHKMLNSIDYYDTISGTTIYNIGNDVTNCLLVNFSSDLVHGKAYTTAVSVSTDKPQELLSAESITKSSPDSSVTIFCDGEDVYTLDNTAKSYTVDENFAVKRENVRPIADNERYWVNENNESCCFYRSDATNTGYAKRCIFSQELAIGCLHDFNLWSIDTIKEYNGRKCYVISGTPEEEYGKKQGVENFTFYVDYETGVLLRYEGYSSSGELVRFLYTDNMEIDEGVYINEKIDLSMYKEDVRTAIN